MGILGETLENGLNGLLLLLLLEMGLLVRLRVVEGEEGVDRGKLRRGKVSVFATEISSSDCLGLALSLSDLAHRVFSAVWELQGLNRSGI